MLRAISAAAALIVAGVGVAFAAVHGEEPEKYPFSFLSPTGSYDMAAVQRGFHVYQQVCANCHSMDHLSYRHLGERGGPFALYMVRDHETGEMGPHVGKPEHGGTFVEVTDNPYVRAIAAGVTITDIDPNSGSLIASAVRSRTRSLPPLRTVARRRRISRSSPRPATAARATCAR
jgi:ubiquinol-cytochrome c reductase cytochrome c1 subunit